MNKLVLFSTLLVCQFGISQNKIEVYQDEYSRYFHENLDTKLQQHLVTNIENSNKYHLRIWRKNQLYDFSSNPKYTSSYINEQTGETFKFEYNLDENLVNHFTIDQLKNLESSYAIGTKPNIIEVVENGKYFIRAVFFNNEIHTFLNNLSNEDFVSKQNSFLKQLPAGNYGQNIKVDHPITDINLKSDFYLKLESELALKQIDTKNPLKQPQIILNGNNAFYKDICNLKLEQIKFYKVFDATESRTPNGVIFIKSL